MTDTGTSVRSVLDAPRGHRFSRPGSTRPMDTPAESPQARRERLLRQMEGNPRVAYMLEHGVLPHWMHVARQQQERSERQAREAATGIPDTPEPAVPVCPARGRHRAPRRWWGWPALAVSAVLLLGLTAAEAVGQEISRGAGFLL